MAKPTPSPSQLEAIQKAKTVALAGAQGAADSVAAIQALIVKYQDIDNFAKSLFDYYNDEVIRNYELERRWMDGQLLANPISQTDLDNFVLNNTGRLWNNGSYDLLRISEFDGTPLAPTDTEYEQNLLSLQDTPIDRLQNGITGMVTFAGTTIATTVDSNSTTVELNSGGSPLTLSIGNRFLIKSGSNSCIVEVTSFTQGGTCSNPIYLDESTCTTNGGTWTPGNATVGILIIIPPQGTLAIGSAAGTDLFDGFNNTERTTKTPLNTWEQALMTSLLQNLQDKFDRRKTILNSELSVMNANGDDNFSLSAKTDVQNSINSINNFLGISPISTIDISDTGITSINTEKTSRLLQITARIAGIASAITAGDFYNKRYNEAANRTQLANGTMVQLSDLQKALAGAQSGQANALSLASRYDNMLA